MSQDPAFREPHPFSLETAAPRAHSSNPYAPTAQVSPAEAVHGDAEAIRKYHLKHEASVKSIGTLYILGAVVMVPIGALAMVAPFLQGNLPATEIAFMVGIGSVYLGLGLLQGFTAVGLWRLRPWARITGTVLSTIGLLGIPIGTLISAYFLYLLLSEKGTMVFSPAYREIITQTPHVKYKTSIVVWILLGILLGILLLVLAAALIGGVVSAMSGG